MADRSGLIPLTEWVGALRGELQQAQQEGMGQHLLFSLGPLELEFEMVATREASGGGDIRFWVVALGGSGKRTRQSTQRVKLTLNPKTISGGPVDVGDELSDVPD